jgi:hypothetical protein
MVVVVAPFFGHGDDGGGILVLTALRFCQLLDCVSEA